MLSIGKVTKHNASLKNKVPKKSHANIGFLTRPQICKSLAKFCHEGKFWSCTLTLFPHLLSSSSYVFIVWIVLVARLFNVNYVKLFMTYLLTSGKEDQAQTGCTFSFKIIVYSKSTVFQTAEKLVSNYLWFTIREIILPSTDLWSNQGRRWMVLLSFLWRWSKEDPGVMNILGIHKAQRDTPASENFMATISGVVKIRKDRQCS